MRIRADEPEKMDGWKRKTAPPIVIDRYHFKEDRTGYLKHSTRTSASSTSRRRPTKMITKGNTDDASPSWSPDGKLIAFLSKRGHADPDRTSNEDLWIVEAREGAEPRQLTKTEQAKAAGRRGARTAAASRVLLGDNDKNGAYGMNKLIVVPANPPAQIGATTRPTIYMPQLDRAVSNIAWSADGQNISFLLQDDRTNHVATVPAENPNGADSAQDHRAAA